MPFLDDVLQRPFYGWKEESGTLVRPAAKQIFADFFQV
jgi:hypothetical protein